MSQTARIIGIAPQFIVPDVVKTAEYYRDVLGFQLNGYFLDPPVFAMVQRDGIEIHFGKSDTCDYKTNIEYRKITSDAYIRVDDAVKMYEELKARGANIIEGPVLRVYGMREVVVKDCNGYLLVFGDG
jgi:catechol 2,3-dioxygenase-like lactoylglutathione lyase family enzyme